MTKDGLRMAEDEPAETLCQARSTEGVLTRPSAVLQWGTVGRPEAKSRTVANLPANENPQMNRTTKHIPALLAAVLLAPLAAQAEEVLYNGIRLPAQWPPQSEVSGGIAPAAAGALSSCAAPRDSDRRGAAAIRR